MLEAWDSRHQTNLSVASYVELYGPRSDSRYRPVFRRKHGLKVLWLAAADMSTIT